MARVSQGKVQAIAAFWWAGLNPEWFSPSPKAYAGPLDFNQPKSEKVSKFWRMVSGRILGLGEKIINKNLERGEIYNYSRESRKKKEKNSCMGRGPCQLPL